MLVTDIRGEEDNLGCASNMPVSGNAILRVPVGFAAGVVTVGEGVDVGTGVEVAAAAAGAVLGAGALVAAGAVVGAGAAVAAGTGVVVGRGVAVAAAPQAITNARSRLAEMSSIDLGLPGRR